MRKGTAAAFCKCTFKRREFQNVLYSSWSPLPPPGVSEGPEHGGFPDRGILPALWLYQSGSASFSKPGSKSLVAGYIGYNSGITFVIIRKYPIRDTMEKDIRPLAEINKSK